MTTTKNKIKVRKASDRGHFDHGWLDTYHTFSFAGYFNLAHTGFRTLRVINEDRVQPGEGFGTHPHSDMEILTYVLQGELAHKDSMGNGSVIRAGEVQRMTAGRGITHSEFNHSPDEPVHFLQIWILPEKKGLEPSYEQRALPDEEKRNRLLLVASRDGGGDSVIIHQDVNVYASSLDPVKAVSFEVQPDRHVWIQVVRGAIEIGGVKLSLGDGVAVEGPERLRITGQENAEFLLFDLA